MTGPQATKSPKLYHVLSPVATLPKCRGSYHYLSISTVSWQSNLHTVTTHYHTLDFGLLLTLAETRLLVIMAKSLQYKQDPPLPLPPPSPCWW